MTVCLSERISHPSILVLCSLGCVVLSTMRSTSLSAQVPGFEDPPVVTIGQANAPEFEVFGSIVDVEVDGEGRIFVLDGQAREVRWFNQEGGFLGRIGRAGQGPGEFQTPMGMVVDENGILYVLDSQRARMMGFEPGPNGYRLLGEIPTMLGAFDFCRVQGGFFILAVPPNGDAVLHRVDDEGTLVRSFGTLVDPDPETVGKLPRDGRHDGPLRWQANRGSLACDEQRGRVVVAHATIPLVRAFRFDGELEWESRLEGFWPVHWEPTERGGIRMRAHPKSGTVHSTQSVAFSEDGKILIGLHEAGWEISEGRFEMRVVEGESGQQVQAFPATMTVAGYGPFGFFGYRQEPWPAVMIHR
jgi:hypothetical protein